MVLVKEDLTHISVRNKEDTFHAPMLSDLQKSILVALDKEGKLTRTQLVKILEKPKSTMHENLIKLRDQGLISQKKLERNVRGRPPYFFKLNDEYVLTNES